MKSLFLLSILTSSMAAFGNSSSSDVDYSKYSISLDKIEGYNVLVFGDFTAPSSKVEGRLAVGGNLNVDGYSIADRSSENEAISLLVGGTATYKNGRVYNGHIAVADKGKGIAYPVKEGLNEAQKLWVEVEPDINFKSIQQEMIKLSSSLITIPNNGTVEYKWGGVYLTGDCSSPLQVFALDGAKTKALHTFDLQCIPENAHIVFNVSNENTGFKNVMFNTPPEKTIFNFYEATQLELTGLEVNGSILAPKANVESPQGTVRGQLVAKSWSGVMDFQNFHHLPLNPGKSPCEGERAE